MECDQRLNAGVSAAPPENHQQRTAQDSSSLPTNHSASTSFAAAGSQPPARPGEMLAQVSEVFSRLAAAATARATASPALAGDGTSAAGAPGPAQALPPEAATLPWDSLMAGLASSGINPLFLQQVNSFLPHYVSNHANTGPPGPAAAAAIGRAGSPQAPPPPVPPVLGELIPSTFPYPATAAAQQQHPAPPSLPGSPQTINFISTDPLEKVCTHCGKFERGQWRKRDNAKGNTLDNALCNRCYMWRRNHGGLVLPPRELLENSCPVSRNNSLPKRISEPDSSSAMPDTPPAATAARNSGAVSPTHSAGQRHRINNGATSPVVRRRRGSSADPDYCPRSNSNSPKHGRPGKATHHGPDKGGSAIARQASLSNHPGQLERQRSRLRRAGGSGTWDLRSAAAGTKRSRLCMSSGGDLDEDADGAGFDDVGAAAVLADLKSAPLPVGMDDTSGAAAGALGNTFPDSTWPDNAPLAIEPLVAAPSGGFASVHQGFDDPLRSLGFNNKQVSCLIDDTHSPDTPTSIAAYREGATGLQLLGNPDKAAAYAAVEEALSAAAAGEISAELATAYVIGVTAKLPGAGPENLNLAAAQRYLEDMQQQVRASPRKQKLVNFLSGLSAQ